MNLIRSFVVALFAVACAAPAAQAQSSRGIRLIVPYAPGSGPDILSRLLADQIGRTQGQTLVVENHPGGGTLVGTEVAARAAPDGGTVLLVANSFVVNPAIKQVSYDVDKTFAPICYAAGTPMVLVVQGSSPYKTLDDLLAAARAKPGELTVGASPLSSLHVALEMVKRSAKVDMTFVPFVSTGPGINALLGGHLTAVFADYPTVVGHLKSGTLRGLVTTSAKRIAPMPDVPTFAEAKLDKYEADIFYGYAVPAKTPPHTVKQLIGWFKTALDAPELQPKLLEQGLFKNGMCGAPFGAFLHQSMEEYARLIKDAGIKAP